jgi:ABC-type dipeptide/oligopeptide/nickel transport system ATPase component
MSDNVRVYEIAEEAGASSTFIIKKAKDLGIELKSPQSQTTVEDAEEIVNYVMTGRSTRLNNHTKTQKLQKKEIPPETISQLINKEPYPAKRIGAKALKGLKIVKKRMDKNNRQDTIIISDSSTQNDLYIDINNDIPLNRNLQDIINKSQIEPIKKTSNVKSTDGSTSKRILPINSHPEVTIEINNLKTIKNLKWDLQKKKGIFAIIGENGSGKSSLLISIGKLINPNIFHLELTGKEHYEKTKINYIINGNKFSWVKNSKTDNKWRESVNSEFIMPKLKGFFESSILSGTRFSAVDEYIKDELDYREEDKINKANDFIVQGMNFVLYGGKKKSYKFNELYEITANRQRQRSKNSKNRVFKTYNYYALKKTENEYIKEHLFSTGEYFLLKLLKFIADFKENGTSIIPAIIIIDEIELSLHPMAQTRLIKHLDTLSEELNFIVIFASHSLHILDNVQPENTYFIENDETNMPRISNPIGRGLLGSKLYRYSTNDKVILVEDDLAKLYIKNTLNDLEFTKIYKTAVIPIGGASQVVKAGILNATEDNMYGDAVVMISLDEDEKSKFINSQHRVHVKYNHHIPVYKNIEYHIQQLVISDNYDFVNFISNLLPQQFTYYDLIISDEKPKGCFNDLITELAKKIRYSYAGNTDSTKIFMTKEIVDFVYKQHKDTEEHLRLIKEIEKLFNHEQ